MTNQAHLRRLMLCASAALATATLLGFVAPAFAADAASEPVKLDELIVTAQLREQTLLTVPVSVQAVSGSTLEAARVTSLDQLVRVAPSVMFQTGFAPQASTINIRGTNSRAIEGGIQPSVGIVIDEVPAVRQAEFVGDLNDVSRIEVLRGPQGTLFGKNSTGGLISIVNQAPEAINSGHVEVEGATDGGTAVRTMVNVAHDDVRLRVNTLYRHLPGIIPNLSGPDGGGSREWRLDGKLAIDFTPTVRWLGSLSYNDGASAYAQGLLLAPNTGFAALQQTLHIAPIREGNTTYNYDGDNFESHHGGALISDLTWELAPNLTLRAISGYRQFASDTGNDLDSLPVGGIVGVGFKPNPLNYPVLGISGIRPKQPIRVAYGSQEFRLNYASPQLDLVGGLFYQDLKDKGRNEGPVVFLPGHPSNPNPFASISSTIAQRTIRDATYAAFADATYRVTPGLSLVGGLRYTRERVSMDYVRSSLFTALSNYDILTNTYAVAPAITAFHTGRTDGAVTGRAGASWQPNAQQNLYLMYSTGFKGAAVDSSRAANPLFASIPPEHARSLEAGLKERFADGRVAVNLAVYSQVIHNIQQSATIPGSRDTRLISAGDLKAKGVELEAGAQLTSDLRIDGGAAYTDARYDGPIVPCFVGQLTTALASYCNIDGGRFQSLTGAQAAGAPRWTYSASASYERPVAVAAATLRARIGYNWTGSYINQPTRDPYIVEPSHGLLDASVTLESRDRRWSVTLYGQNLTDNLYYVARFQSNNVVGRSFGYLSRDYGRYAGVILRASY